MTVTITSFPRIHFSLLDLSADGYRMYGGIGMAIQALPLRLQFEAAHEVDMSALREHSYDSDSVRKIELTVEAAAALHGLSTSLRLTGVTGVMRHMGLGSGTRVALSAVEAIFAMNNMDAPHRLVMQRSSRGGASGIGLQTYFEGGLCLDIGRPRIPGLFQSSDMQAGSFELPTVACTTPMPNWPMYLVLPTKISPVTQDQENNYFSKATPISDAAVHEAVYVALFGLYGGARSNDYGAFCRALNRLQQLPWKQGEIALHGAQFVKVSQLLVDGGANAVGMSSLGPAMICFGELSSTALVAISEAAKVISITPRNSGREISLE